MNGSTAGKTLLQFGAGNIGRSLLGQLFSRAGYRVVFVDINSTLVKLINKQGAYRVVVKQSGKPDEIIIVNDVSAIDGRDVVKVSEAVAAADIVGTSVGKSVLPLLAPVLADGIKKRFADGADRCLDIILAENVRDGAEVLSRRIADHLPEDVPLTGRVGVVGTSIGKMVPIMRDEDLVKDPLWVFAEPYNKIIVDRCAFCGAVPEVKGLEPVDNIAAYVDRKLFIHNLGHAATAYLGYLKHPELETIAEQIEVPEIRREVVAAMRSAAGALVREYPDDFAPTDLEEHIQDLVGRFANQALGDTVYRVGRDVPRKLGPDDRLVGAARLAYKHNCDRRPIETVIAAAFFFEATDESGALYPEDAHFREEGMADGVESTLVTICGLTEETDREIRDEIMNEYNRLAGERRGRR